MTYDIKIVGHNEVMRLDNGEMIKADWEEYKKNRSNDRMIEVQGLTCQLSDIKWFRAVKGTGADTNKTIENVDAEYLKSIKQIRSWPLDVRAKQLGFFRMLYWGFTGKKSEEILCDGIPMLEMWAEKLQRKFFEANPKRVICDPVVFREIIDSKNCDAGVMSVLENVVRQDSFAATRL